MQTQTPPAEPAKKKLSPAELYDHLVALANGIDDWKIDDAISKAQEALDAIKARKDRVAAKQLRIVRATSIEEAEAILKEVPADTNLKKLCGPLGGWKKMQEEGATDEQLVKVLSKWPSQRSYPCEIPQAMTTGYGNQGIFAWVDPDKSVVGDAHLKGAALIAAVRRVMNVPKPSSAKPAAVKKPAPKSPAAKKPPAKKPASEAAAKSEPAAVIAPSKERQPGPQGKHSQTWGQWAASLRSGGVDMPIDLPEREEMSPEQSHYLEAFRAGTRPAAARDQWKKLQAALARGAAARPKAAEPEEEDVRPDKSKVKGLAFPAEDLKLDGAQLSASLDGFNVRPSSSNGWKIPTGPTIGKPINLPRSQALDCLGGWFAVVGASVKREETVYQLVPLYTPIESNMEGIVMLTWAQARDADPRKGNPPESVDLLGVQVFDGGEPEEPWILGSIEDSVYVSVAKSMAPAAPPEDDDEAARAHFSAARQATWDDLADAARPLMHDTGVDDAGRFIDPDGMVVPMPPGPYATYAFISVAQSAIDDQWRAGCVWQSPAGNGGTPACVQMTGASSREYAVRYQAQQLVVHLRQLGKDARGEIAAQMKAAVKAAEAFVKQCPKGPEGK